MNRILKSIVGWFAINVLVVIPLFGLLTQDFADEFLMDMKSEGPFTIEVFSVRSAENGAAPYETAATIYCETNVAHRGHLHFHFPGKRDIASLGVCISEVTNDISISSIRVRSRILFEHRLDVAGIQKSFSGADGASQIAADGRSVKYRFSGGYGRLVPTSHAAVAWTFGFSGNFKIWGLVLFGELVLWLIAFVLTFLAHETMRPRGIVLRTGLLSLALAAFYCIILPVQSFLVNESLFTFAFGDLLKSSGLSCLLTFAFAFVALLILYRVYRIGLFHAVLVAFLVYEYLETGFFAMGDAQLNGELTGLSNRVRMAWDTASLLGLLGIAVVFRRMIFGSLHLISLGFVLMTGLSLLDVKCEAKAVMSGDLVVTDYSPKPQVAQSAFYSDKRNVIVFVLDMSTSEIADDVMRQDAELRKKFSGFINYRNNVGMHMYTGQGTAGIFTGKYLEDFAKLPQYFNAKFSSHSFIVPYLAADVPMFILPGDVQFGYSNRLLTSVASDVAERKQTSSVALERIKGEQPWNLFEILLFRSTPFALKSLVFRVCMLSWPRVQNFIYEPEVYPVVAARAKTHDCDLTLHYYHTEGSHEPLLFDRKGHRYAQARFGYEAHREQLWYALRQLGDVLDAYRSAGIYDKSLIIICGDHGADYTNGTAPVAKDFTRCGIPFLWVKPEGSSDSWEESEMPTSHANISRTVREALDHKLSRADVDRLLLSKDRVYRRIKGATISDFHVDATGGVRVVESQVVKSVGDLMPLENDVLYSFHSTSKGPRADVICEGAETDYYTIRFMPDSSKMVLRVKGKEPLLVSDVILNVSYYGRLSNLDRTHQFSFEATGCAKVECRMDSDKRCVELLGAKSDADGVFTIECFRGENSSSLFVDSVLLRTSGR